MNSGSIPGNPENTTIGSITGSQWLTVLLIAFVGGAIGGLLVGGVTVTVNELGTYGPIPTVESAPINDE